MLQKRISKAIVSINQVKACHVVANEKVVFAYQFEVSYTFNTFELRIDISNVYYSYYCCK